MLVNVAVALAISRVTPPPDRHIQEMVERIRKP
jgi:hypothetical protein